jgi:hypothetical protein
MIKTGGGGRGGDLAFQILFIFGGLKFFETIYFSKLNTAMLLHFKNIAL